MDYLIYIGIYLLIVGSTIFFADITSPLVDDDYRIIEESKLKQWVRKLKNGSQNNGKGEVNNK